MTGWTPHWMFGRYKLKILDDPKQIYGKAESIHTVVWKDFSEKYPFVAELLRNIRLDDQQISSLMATIEKTKNGNLCRPPMDERTSGLSRVMLFLFFVLGAAHTVRITNPDDFQDSIW